MEIGDNFLSSDGLRD